MREYLTAAAALALVSSPALAQSGPVASDSAQATAYVMKPLSVECGLMDFGVIAPLSSGTATIVMPANGQPVQDINNIVVPGTRDFASPANCIATGEPNYKYKVTLPSTSTNLTNGSAALELSAFTISAELDGMPYNRLLLSSGQDSFGVGATLKVPAQSPPGLYTGVFQVSVQYE